MLDLAFHDSDRRGVDFSVVDVESCKCTHGEEIGIDPDYLSEVRYTLGRLVWTKYIGEARLTFNNVPRMSTGVYLPSSIKISAGAAIFGGQ